MPSSRNPGNLMRKALNTICTLLLSLIIEVPGSNSDAQNAEEVTSLTLAEGWQNVRDNCTECHSALLIAQNSGSKAVWESRIRWMQNTQGLHELTPELEESILNYLATNYGQKASSRRAPLKNLLLPSNPYGTNE